MDVHDLMLLVRDDDDAALADNLFCTLEIAFVGKAPGQYSMLLGGGYHGQRLNKIYRGWYWPFFSPPLNHPYFLT